jgi:hypothetical protein
MFDELGRRSLNFIPSRVTMILTKFSQSLNTPFSSLNAILLWDVTAYSALIGTAHQLKKFFAAPPAL